MGWQPAVVGAGFGRRSSDEGDTPQEGPQALSTARLQAHSTFGPAAQVRGVTPFFPQSAKNGLAPLSAPNAGSAALGEQPLQALNPLEQGGIAEGVGEPQVSARAEGLPGNDRDIRLFQDEVGKFES